MNEESDGMNESENNSEVVILPERSHMEELLLSDQSQLREDQNAYERKLDEKLRDLGLYEDDMTINQKEELLAVVVISCETAEQEENKRQLIREYLEGAQSLEEEIEFSYQESAWLAGEASNLLCSTVTQLKEDDTSSNTKILSSFMDGEASTSEIRNFDALSLAEKSLTRNSPDIFEDEMAYGDTVEAHASTSESTQRRSMRPKSHSKGTKRDAAGLDVKVAIAHPIIHDDDDDDDNPETTEILDRQLSFQRDKLLLDKSMNCWRPCSSPKDKPLSNFRLKKKKEEDVSAVALQEKFNKYLTAFEKIGTMKPKKSPASKIVQLGKPYVLMHQGTVAKKVTKLDNYDYIIGVSEKNQNNEDNEDNFLPCDETLTRTKSAFHRVKPLGHGKLITFPDPNPPSESATKVTRSGATYGSKRFKSEHHKTESSPEIILDDSYNQMPSTSKDNSAQEKRVTFNEDAVNESNSRLPKFSDLRPDITKCKMVVPSPIMQKDSTVMCDNSVKTNCDLNSSRAVKKFKKEEAAGSRVLNDFSSDSSSPLIDVETVVDEEIEQFVLKRKLGPSSQKSLNAKNTAKRSRKSES